MCYYVKGKRVDSVEGRWGIARLRLGHFRTASVAIFILILVHSYLTFSISTRTTSKYFGNLQSSW
jgi:hypothetical protein